MATDKLKLEFPRTPSARTALWTLLLIGTAYAANAHAKDGQARTCESLSSLKLPNTTITAAQSIPAGGFQPPGSATIPNLPAFCRVTATISPVSDSAIGIEIWLPSTNWNGKYQQSGTHGWGGTFFWGEMANQIRRGYATGITNDGHTGGGFNVSWGFGHPAKVVDFAYRAVHELSEKAKLTIAAFYGSPPRYAYFNGCSSGGRQALKSAQMFPKDFDGIIGGGAAAYQTHASTEQLIVSINLLSSGLTGQPGANLLTLAQNGATAACDASDGVVDGLIRDPRTCHFDPHTLVCKSAGQSNCLTQAQADAIKANYGPVVDPVTGKFVFSGMSPASEFNQINFGYNTALAPFGVTNYALAYNNPNWDPSTFNLHRDLPVLDRELGFINAIDPDLGPFKRAGGKLIQWHGWDDAAFTPGWATKYYEEVVEQTGRGNNGNDRGNGHSKLEDVQDFYRLFMLPSVGHCGSGPGPDNIGGENQTAVSNDPEHDVVSALEAWVERGVAPKKLIATKFINNDPTQGIAIQRPICPYPSEAVYKSGNTNSANSFVCASPQTNKAASNNQ
jgi:feruloyl esterase